MAEIAKIVLERTEQYAIYDDCDSQTDYFHSTRGSLKYIISRVQEKGAKTILVEVTNNDQTIPATRRINQICKRAGYAAKDISEMRTYNRGYPDEFSVKHLEWVLSKNMGGN